MTRTFLLRAVQGNHLAEDFFLGKIVMMQGCKQLFFRIGALEVFSEDVSDIVIVGQRIVVYDVSVNLCSYNEGLHA